MSERSQSLLALPLLQRLQQYWRICAVGIGFASFGVGGLVLGILVFPLLGAWPWHAAQRANIAKWIIHHAFRSLIGLMNLLGVFSYEVRGLERLRHGGLLILANHPTLLDTVFLMSFVDRADCIVKASLANNLFMGKTVRAAGYVFNDSGADMVQDCIRSLRAGNNMIIFPEGTRTLSPAPMRLKRGAARIALQGGMDITPVRIHCANPFLRRGEPWYSLPVRRTHFEIVVGDTIAVRDFASPADGEAMAARRLTDHLTRYFSTDASCAKH
ncbi:MAG: glycerol acyltransferase [Rhodoferax sp.]|nr:glycerol acyltransferase [Rhodoferax sp.]